MYLEMHEDPFTRNRIFRVVLTEQDILDAWTNMTDMDIVCMREFSREEASMEETLMALQIYARLLQKKVTT